MIDREIVFIADRVKDHSNASIASYDLEKLADNYYIEMRNSLKNCAPEMTYYDSPKQFLNNISKHKSSLVFSLWSGELSRSRRALVPSICEAYSIPYVGADPYIHTICADKHLSKVLCNRYNIKSAKDVIVTSTYDFPLLKSLRFPVVIKPNYEGGSIGIFDKNLVDDYISAIKVCDELLLHFPQILVEEYIKGEEVSICIAGINNTIDVFEVTRVSVDGKTYFNHSILGAESKKMKKTTNVRNIITDIFPKTEKEKMINLYNDMGKVEFMRIDGRIDNNIFTLIELTPDCSLSPSSSMFLAFKTTGFISHANMIEKICENSLRNQVKGYQSANK